MPPSPRRQIARRVQRITRWCLPSLALCAFAGGCRQDAPTGQAVILVSGDTNGWITPCGCASNQSGGLPRRGELVQRRIAEGPTIVVDVGGAPGGTAPYDRMKFEAVLRGELAMGLVAHNIGHAEARLGADELARLADQLTVPWLSANVSDTAGNPIGEAARIVPCAGRRLAIVGVLDPAFATEQLPAAPVVPSVLAALAAIEGQFDSAIVLAYLEEDTLRETAGMLPEVDAVIGGPTGQPIPPTRLGPTLLTSATNQGKFVAQIEVPAEAAPWQAEVIELDETYCDDAEQVANVRRFYGNLASRRFTAAETSFTAPVALAGSGGEVAGGNQCKTCHPQDHETWQASGHAHAWASLQQKSAHVDPECQRCHTTGYKMPGGYDGLATQTMRLNVGCESCHGPSEDHARQPETPTAWHGRAQDSCTACHDRENSPHFNYDAYWPKIVHGASPEEPPQEEPN